MKIAYRLFRVSKDFMPETLFHTWKGSRTLPLDEVMVSPRKRVYNPGGRTNPGFIAGWHMALTYEEADRLRTTRFKDLDSLVICRIYVDKIRKKPRTNVGAWQAQHMEIRSEDWHRALSSAG